MLISASVKNNFFAQQLVIPDNRVGLDNFQSKTNMRFGIDVRQCGGKVKIFIHVSLFLEITTTNSPFSEISKLKISSIVPL